MMDLLRAVEKFVFPRSEDKIQVTGVEKVEEDIYRVSSLYNKQELESEIVTFNLREIKKIDKLRRMENFDPLDFEKEQEIARQDR